MANFGIYIYGTDLKVGSVYKKYTNAVDGCASSSAIYIIEMPPNLNWKNKLMIISAVQMLD